MSFKKSISQPYTVYRFKQHLNNFLILTIIIKHFFGQKFEEKLGGSLIGSYINNNSILPFRPTSKEFGQLQKNSANFKRIRPNSFVVCRILL